MERVACRRFTVTRQRQAHRENSSDRSCFPAYTLTIRSQAHGSALGAYLNTSFFSRTRGPWTAGLVVVGITLVVALTYWPVLHASFVWDDVLDFQRTAWLRQGDGWRYMLLQKFNDWTNYFRPLVIALFTAEIRAFGVQPGPMHTVSLLLHLLNTILVGELAARTSKNLRHDASWLTRAVPMLLYGLHPLLIESVVWIGCQFDLVATLFMLMGLLLNTSTRHPIGRAIGVAISFFLAACSKESAAAFPLLLIVFDWFALKDLRNERLVTRLKVLCVRNRLVYLFTLAAGIAYLALRHWALGSLALESSGDALPFLARFQQACFLYLKYWRMFFWPMTGMGPLHPLSVEPFYTVSTKSLLQDAFAIGIVIASVVLTLRRSYLGGLMIAVTFALLPVMHIIAANLDASLYHERYAMMALAAACVLLPSVWMTARIPERIALPFSRAALTILVAWLALSITNIRLTIPLWSTQLALWQWAEQENPDYIGAKDELISAYIDAGDNARAWRLINQVAAGSQPCPNCLLNGASLAITRSDLEHASYFLDKIKSDPAIFANKSTYRFYLTTQSKLLILQNHLNEAEDKARLAIASDNLDPEPQLVLAMALALQGKFTEAQKTEDLGIQLLAPEERAQRLQSFEAWMSDLRNEHKDK
jgi:hypothetical protein